MSPVKGFLGALLRGGLTAALLGMGPGAASAQDAAASVPIPGLEGAGIEQRIGDSLPLDVELRDSAGGSVALAEFFGEKPVILAPVYYECPMLCQLVLDGLVRSLRGLKFTADTDYELVVFSFDPRETPEQASAKRVEALERFGDDGEERAAESAPGWHFLTGDEEQIRRLTDALGFQYEWDAEIEQYVHAAGIVVATPEGKVARYFYGVEYPPKDLRLGLVEASNERLGSVVDQVLLYCYRYDATVGRYTAVTMNILRLGGLVTILGLAALITLLLRAERSRKTA